MRICFKKKLTKIMITNANEAHSDEEDFMQEEDE